MPIANRASYVVSFALAAMPKRVLVVSASERKVVDAQVAFARLPVNHYRPGPGATSPGDDPRFCLRLGLRSDFECVFSFTVMDGGLWRHLSISLINPPGLPHPAAVVEIARLYGFVDEPTTWQMGHHEAERCIVVAQLVTA